MLWGDGTDEIFSREFAATVNVQRKRSVVLDVWGML